MFFVFDSDGNVFCDAGGYETADDALQAYAVFRRDTPGYDDTVRIAQKRLGDVAYIIMPNGRTAYRVKGESVPVFVLARGARSDRALKRAPVRVQKRKP